MRADVLEALEKAYRKRESLDTFEDFMDCLLENLQTKHNWYYCGRCETRMPVDKKGICVFCERNYQS